MYSVKGCRQIYNKTISRPLLIKGLEFNHAILIDADALKPKELYVSLTRGSNYLTILSEDRIIRPKYKC
jgi:DNA helicase-2/ATP-dependent DNA helicase PcrA